MTKKPFDGKFNKDLHILTRATRGEVYLGNYPKLIKKIKKHFLETFPDIEFCNEPESDNLYLLDLIKEELNLNIAA
jgi:hypothetical protein